MARLSASVPPEVKITRQPSPCTTEATACRHAFMALAICREGAYSAEGLKKLSRMHFSAACAACAHTRVVALLSR